MNINNTTPSVLPAAPAQSVAKSTNTQASTAVNAAGVNPAEGGKTLPPDKVNAAQGANVVASIGNVDEADKATEGDEAKSNAQGDTKALEQAVETANDFVQTVQRDLHFSIDQESERTVVKVVESSSGDVIRQIPNESFLEMARNMKELGEVSLVDATG